MAIIINRNDNDNDKNNDNVEINRKSPADYRYTLIYYYPRYTVFWLNY